MTEYLGRYPTMHEYAEGKRINPKLTDLISRADAIEAVCGDCTIERKDKCKAEGYCYEVQNLMALPSAEMPKGDLISRADVLKYPIRLDHYDEVNGSREFVYGVESVIEYVESLPSAVAESDDLIIKGAKGIQDGLYNIKDGKLFKYKAKGGTVRTYPIVPSADAVCKAHEDEHLNIINRIKELQYAIAKTQTIVGKLVESADAEPKWNCTANFVAEQLDRLRKMTDEEKWEFFKKFFEIKGGDDE